MKKHKVKKQLKKLKQVEPDKDFVEGTHRLLMTTQPERRQWTNMPQWAWATAGAALVLTVAVVSGAFLQNEPKLSSSLESDELKKELKGLSVQIDRVNYQQETDRIIASALNEISSSKGSHLKEPVLEEELNKIQNLQKDSKSKNINNLLDKVIF